MSNKPDETELIRRVMVQTINAREADRGPLEKRYGQVWSTQEASRDFTFLGFMAPFAMVQQKSTAIKGSLMFRDHPRFYFSWSPTT
jgi:hypothetical protein